ncbi:cobalt ECF transporter T component CbiQ [Nocardioides marmoribigeumensis]|uniref:Cobalt/nickel transport system permease protein n=1 Tax=Nocardioides marmoribigeumensis TaxID=433649 RepID=A0ABU2C0E4_9ACTN|nr:cobalt ECF transporter T component CbiQ [Nocardioides marmoribigeumensis]MDR7364147.1 cobalt/nickel transport system permease protein [Nocardioides marmoribigeumensis]
MGAGHGHRVHFHGHSPLHRARPERKVLAVVLGMLLVVATPHGWWPAFALYAALLLGLVALSRVPVGYLAPRLLVELPFLVFALVLPFVATGERVEVLGLDVSRPGLVAAGTLVVKGTLGVLAALLLAATTEPRDILRGLERLRVPAPIVQIMSFMVRYLDVVTSDMARMRIALQARGFEARNPRHWPVLARSAGALFIRSYERGERVHLAMLSRGHRP